MQTVAEHETNRYGIIDPLESDGRLYGVNRFVEKPPLGEAPSNLAIMGRYILTPEIFAHLEKQETGAGGEIQLTDAIQMLNQEQSVYAYDFEGTRYDVGEKLGFVLTTLDFAMQRDELKDELINKMREYIESKKMVQP